MPEYFDLINKLYLPREAWLEKPSCRKFQILVRMVKVASTPVRGELIALEQPSLPLRHIIFDEGIVDVMWRKICQGVFEGKLLQAPMTYHNITTIRDAPTISLTQVA